MIGFLRGPTVARRGTVAVVRRAVREHLARSPAFGRLPPDERREIARDLVRVSTYLAAPEGIPANTIAGTVVVFSELIQAIDFPNFVEGLIRGVFEAIVDSSIQQMRAYGELLKEVANDMIRFRMGNAAMPYAFTRESS